MALAASTAIASKPEIAAAAPPAPQVEEALTVIVLAGDRDGDPLARAFGSRRKALVPAGGIPMLVRVLNALDSVPLVGAVIVLANRVEELENAPELREHRPLARPALRFIEGRGSPVTSLSELHERGLAATPTLVVTADSPLLNAEAIGQFVRRAKNLHADLAVGMVSENHVRAVFPGMARTYFRLKDGAFKSINLFAFLNPRGWEILSFWRETEKKRKRPWQLVFLFGLPALLKVVFGRMSLAESFAHGSAVVGVRIAALPMSDGHLAADVDQPQHLRAVEGALLRARQQESGERRVLAIFDLDRTLTRFGTYSPFLLYAAARLKPWQLAMVFPVLLAMIGHRLKFFDRDRLKGVMQSLMLGPVDREVIAPIIEDYAAWVVERGLRPGARDALARETAAGATVVLASASYDLYVQPIAARLGIAQVIATRARLEGDTWRPGIEGANCYGAEKQRRVEEWLTARGDSVRPYLTFYTDDKSDRPTLEIADEPVVVNPKRGFAKRARGLGWPVVRW
jgi:HAD superfamily hydrolase (TIGR01490 family)